jgi:uncharacterized RDD family membrane protein YckC
MEQMMQQPPMTPSRVVTYAGFWKRFAAYMLDKLMIGFVAAIICIPMALVFGLSAAMHMDENESPLAFLVAMSGLIVLFAMTIFICEWLYFALMESKRGATLGKMILGIRVTDMEGRPVTFGRASGRYFGKILSGLTLYVGFIIAGFTQQKQALHDILAKTLVVNNY